MDFTTLQYFYIGLAMFIVGFTKTSVGGVGVLAVLLMAMVIPGKASVGVLLPMMVVADMMAVVFYRRACQWGILLKLLPLTLVGLGIGYAILRFAPGANFERIIGWFILLILVLDISMNERVLRHMRGPVMTGIAGMTGGVVSMVANVAGPVFGIYLLQMGLTKTEFVGTRSWFFLVLNVAKLPLAAHLGLINKASLGLDLMFLPMLFVGAVVGYKVLQYINITLFKWFIRLAALVAVGRLFLP